MRVIRRQKIVRCSAQRDRERNRGTKKRDVPPRGWRFLQVPPRLKNGGETGFPLPSTGRGIEGGGWADQAAFPITSTWAFPPLTPALSPLRGEGDGSTSRIYAALQVHHAGTSKMRPDCRG